MSLSPPAGSFNVSQALRALGIRDPRVIPTIQGGQVLPTISFGTFETFTPEVVEARGLLAISLDGISGVGAWRGYKMLSIAPGGSIIEAFACQPNAAGLPAFFLAIGRTDPWPGVGLPMGNTQVWTIGGQQLVNAWNNSTIQIGSIPSANNVPNSSGTGPQWPLGAVSDGNVYSRVWVPAGWWFWIAAGQTADQRALVRWREIPQAQGAA